MNIILRIRAAVHPWRSVFSRRRIAPVQANSMRASSPNSRFAYPAAVASQLPRTLRNWSSMALGEVCAEATPEVSRNAAQHRQANTSGRSQRRRACCASSLLTGRESASVALARRELEYGRHAGCLADPALRCIAPVCRSRPFSRNAKLFDLIRDFWVLPEPMLNRFLRSRCQVAGTGRLSHSNNLAGAFLGASRQQDKGEEKRESHSSIIGQPRIRVHRRIGRRS
jgi:hypothetical protein